MTVRADDKDFFKYTKNHRFAAMYPLLAKEIIERYKITSGVCLDIGTGNAALPIEISKISDLHLIALDLEQEVIDMARENCKLHGVPNKRIDFVVAPVENIHLDDESADLIISRGSIPFWDDHVIAFKEIQRVLTYGGVAMVGCGFSKFQTMEEVKKMRPVWSPEILEERTRWKKGSFLSESLHKAEISNFNIINDSYGTWVEIRKTEKN
jgi:ubiquinone/menaquinone biosynthesis C-methylase UbiE